MGVLELCCTTPSGRTAHSAICRQPPTPKSALLECNGTGRFRYVGAPRPVPLHHRAIRAQMKPGLYSSADETRGSGQKQPLMVHNEALPSQQHLEPPVAETTALTGESPQSLPQPGIPRPARTISHRHPHTADNPARPPLAQLKRGAYKERQPLAWQRASPFFCKKVLQRCVVQHGVRQ